MASQSKRLYLRIESPSVVMYGPIQGDNPFFEGLPVGGNVVLLPLAFGMWAVTLAIA